MFRSEVLVGLNVYRCIGLNREEMLIRTESSTRDYKEG